MKEKKRLTIAENQRQREAYEVKKAKVFEGLHQEIRDYINVEARARSGS